MVEKQKTVYIHILLDTLYKKDKLLAEITELTREQEKLLARRDFTLEDFEGLMTEKEKLIQELNQLEDGFELLYQRLGKISPEDSELRESVSGVQRLIRSITDKSVALQALEARNKEKLILFLSGKRREIRSFHDGSRAAEKYQSNMGNQHLEGQSYFMDKKK